MAVNLSAIQKQPVEPTGVNLSAIQIPDPTLYQRYVEPVLSVVEEVPHRPPPEEIRDRPLTAPELEFEELPRWEKMISQAGFTFGKFLKGGIEGTVGLADRLLNPEAYGQHGRIEVAKEAGKGIVQMFADVPAQVDWTMAGVAEALSFGVYERPGLQDRSESVIVNWVMPKLTGKTPEEYRRQAVSAHYESAGTDLAWAAIMGRTAARLGKKLAKKPIRKMTQPERAQVQEAFEAELEAGAPPEVVPESPMAVPQPTLPGTSPLAGKGLQFAPEVPLPRAGPLEVPVEIRPGTPIVQPPRPALAKPVKGKAPVGPADPTVIGRTAFRRAFFGSEVGMKAGGAGVAAAIAYKMFSDSDDDVAQGFEWAGVGGLLAFGKGLKTRLRLGPNLFTRPFKKIGDSPAGIEGKQLAVKAFARAKMGEAVATTTLSDAFNSRYGGIKNVFRRRRDMAWMRDNFKGLIERPGEVKAPNADIQYMADTWNAIHQDIGGMLEQMGHRVRVVSADGSVRTVPFKRNPRYFTHSFTEKAAEAMETTSGELYDAIAKATKTHGFDPRWFGSELSPYTAKLFGPIDYARIANFPEYVTTASGKRVKILETDPFRIARTHFRDAGRRIAVLKEFGLEPTAKAKQIGKALQREQGSVAREAFEDMWQDLNGVRVTKRAVSSIIDIPLTLARTGQLTLAALANVGGYFPVAARHPLSFFRAFRDSYRNSRTFEPLVEARRLGGWSYDTLSDLYMIEDMRGISRAVANKTLRATGMNAINRHINKVGSLAAMYDLERGLGAIRHRQTGALKSLVGLTEKQYRASLRRNFNFTDADITRMVERGPNRADLARVAQMTPEATNLFRETGYVRPRWMSHYAARQVFAYTGFVRAIGNVLSDAVQAAKGGNILPLATYAFGAVLSGEAIQTLKGLVLDREREDPTFLARLWHDLLFAGALGLPGEAAQRVEFAIKYNEDALDLNPPPMRALQEWFNMFAQVYDKPLEEWPEELKKQAPRVAQSNIPALKAMYRSYNRFLTTNQDAYIASRLKNSVYLQAGRTAEGQRYRPGQPRQKAPKRTVEALMGRATSRQAILQRIRRERLEERKKKRQRGVENATEQ